MSKNLFTPNVITIKIFAVGPLKVSHEQISELLNTIGTVMDVTSTPMMFDGNSLVPAPTEAVKEPVQVPAAPPATVKEPAASKTAKKPASSKVSAPKQKKEKPAETTPKVITFTEGSDPEKIWQLIRNSSAMTSTQIREKLGLGSNIVNTTVYRLKNAGMIRPMSYNAPNGDTLYTSTEWDAKPVEMPASREPVADVSAADLLDGIDDEVL